jgi:hypothetical protein
VPTEGNTTGGGSYEEVMKVLQSWRVPTEEVAELVKDVTPSMVRRTCDVPSLVITDM